MSLRAIGIILIWLGTLALVAVLQQRLRRRHWDQAGLEVPTPPVERWQGPAALVGIALTLAGGMLMVWDG